MLKPTKHSHPDRTILAVSSLILKRLLEKRLESYEELKKFITSKTDGVESLILPSIDLLFLLGVLEYRPKADAFEYTGVTDVSV
ncbi:MAG: ABC-three component system middle component 8 [Vampirovibrionales bacterium]